jgi:glucose/arabinose dehydrogenase
MTHSCALRRRLLVAGALVTIVAATSWPLMAQQGASSPPTNAPAAAPAPLPAPTIQSVMADRPKSEAAQKLAPVAPPPFATAADKIPVDKLKPPNGFNIEVYATGMVNARSLRQGDKGTIFVSSRLTDKIYAITDSNGKREARPVLTGLNRPNGIAFHNGTLYVAELSQVSKIEDIESKIDQTLKPTVIYSDLPKDEPHGWKFLTVGPDNRLYFQVGAPCNICMPSDAHAQIRSINLDGSDMKVVARGIRQIVGMDWHPVTGQLYFTENQRDWLSEEFPEDKLNRVANPGKDNFGFPYCHQGNMPDPEFGWGHDCKAEFTQPLVLLGPHSAPLGMRFYTGAMFPAEYRGAILVARHGSWNKTKKFGGDIVLVKLNEDGTVRSVEPFITGFVQDNSYIGRPVDLHVMKDGSVLFSDDWNGAVYRVTYGEAPVAHR